jgi:predicted kinase
MQEIIFLQGLPASGKTTWAINYCKEHPLYKRLSKDDIRIELGNKPYSREFENEVIEVQRLYGQNFLDLGFSIIIDDTNFSPKHWEFWSKFAFMRPIGITKKIFDLSVAECIDRDSKREKMVGKDVIMDMYNRYVKSSFIRKDERFILQQDVWLPPCVICDIDGTLALINGRNPYDNSLVHMDKINFPVRSILIKEDLSEPRPVIYLFSGRMDSSQEVTEKWLKEHYIPYDYLIMRKSNDFRPDEIVKKEMYEEYIKDKYYVLYVLDDRDKVVKMWRELGLLCLQVYYGNF